MEMDVRPQLTGVGGADLVVVGRDGRLSSERPPLAGDPPGRSLSCTQRGPCWSVFIPEEAGGSKRLFAL